MSQRKHQRQCLYIEVGLLEEIREEAFRQDRSLSWIMQRAWVAARAQVSSTPGANDHLPLANDDGDDDAEADVDAHTQSAGNKT